MVILLILLAIPAIPGGWAAGVRMGHVPASGRLARLRPTLNASC